MNPLFEKSTLDQLARHYGTDKSSERHDYMRFYEFFLRPYKLEQFTLLELGVGPKGNKGKSLLTWQEYFPNATIVGVDIRPDAKELESNRIIVEVGDCSDPAFLDGLGDKYNPAIIIDDASHKWSHQTAALEHLFGALLPGGIFIVEDINTSFGAQREKYGDSSADTYSYLARLACVVAGGGRAHPLLEVSADPKQPALARQIDVIVFYRHTALVVKGGKRHDTA